MIASIENAGDKHGSLTYYALDAVKLPHTIKTWVLCRYLEGEISTSAEEARREHIIDASFVSQAQVQDQSKPVFPEILASQFWDDLSTGFPEFRYLGNREMDFY